MSLGTRYREHSHSAHSLGQAVESLLSVVPSSKKIWDVFRIRLEDEDLAVFRIVPVSLLNILANIPVVKKNLCSRGKLGQPKLVSAQ